MVDKEKWDRIEKLNDELIEDMLTLIKEYEKLNKLETIEGHILRYLFHPAIEMHDKVQLIEEMERDKSWQTEKMAFTKLDDKKDVGKRYMS